MLILPYWKLANFNSSKCSQSNSTGQRSLLVEQEYRCLHVFGRIRSWPALQGVCLKYNWFRKPTVADTNAVQTAGVLFQSSSSLCACRPSGLPASSMVISLGRQSLGFEESRECSAKEKIKTDRKRVAGRK